MPCGIDVCTIENKPLSDNWMERESYFHLKNLKEDFSVCNYLFRRISKILCLCIFQNAYDNIGLKSKIYAFIFIALLITISMNF